MPKKSITIVTINFRTPDLTVQCLASVFNSNTQNVSVVVVDNNSGDNSVEQIEQAIRKNKWSWAKVIGSPVNGGFSSGNNLRLRDLDSDYFLLLNSDTMLREGALDNLRETLDSNPDIGMACPRLEWEDGSPQESCFRFIRPPYELIKSSGTGTIAKILPQYVTAIPVSSTAISPEWASFACILIRQKVFSDIGFLDENYFMYFEDTDFCYRARNAGWKILYNPKAKVVHLRGKSSPVKSLMSAKKRLPRYFYESRSYYYYRHFGRSGLLAANILWNVGWMIASLRSLLDRKFNSPVASMQWHDIWINFLDPVKSHSYQDSNR